MQPCPWRHANARLWTSWGHQKHTLTAQPCMLSANTFRQPQPFVSNPIFDTNCYIANSKNKLHAQILCRMLASLDTVQNSTVCRLQLGIAFGPPTALLGQLHISLLGPARTSDTDSERAAIFNQIFSDEMPAWMPLRRHARAARCPTRKPLALLRRTPRQLSIVLPR